jgi:hypothetical protein
VEQAVPLIYTREVLPPALRPWHRAVAMGVAIGCLAILATGAWLRPEHSGISTHTQLGFPPCQFEVRTGLPCPSCGFTTSVSHFAHGNMLASAYLQPMGFVIAVCCAAGVWIGSYIAFTGRPVHRLVGMLPGRTLVIGLTVVALAAWGWKIWIHLSGRDHWPL